MKQLVFETKNENELFKEFQKVKFLKKFPNTKLGCSQALYWRPKGRQGIEFIKICKNIGEVLVLRYFCKRKKGLIRLERRATF